MRPEIATRVSPTSLDMTKMNANAATIARTDRDKAASRCRACRTRRWRGRWSALDLMRFTSAARDWRTATPALPDIGLLTLTEVAGLAGYRCEGGEDSGDRRCRHRFRRRGECRRARFTNWNAPDWPVVTSKTRNFRNVADILPANRLIEVEEMNGKNQAAVAARNAITIFMIIARTDARAVENFEGAVKRARRLSRGRRGRDFSRSAANAGGVPRFRQGSEGAACSRT